HSYPEAHFAVFPEKLIEPCVLAGCPQWICKKCGKARERIVKQIEFGREKTESGYDRSFSAGSLATKRQAYRKAGYENPPTPETTGWTDCGCGAGWKGGIVLDPFMGSGTTAHVAYKLGRRYIGFEISSEYIKLCNKRMAQMDLIGEGY
ncbi:unnamed protein product, partial [marine sediment metagenome]